MKNRNLLLCGITMLTFLLSSTFTSCKKEDPTIQTNNLSVDTSMVISAKSFAVSQRKNLLFEITSEPTNTLTANCGSTTNWCSIQGWSSYSIQRSTTYARAGTYSTRYELRKTDGDVAGSKRAETNRYTKSDPIPKCERWYGTSYYLTTDYYATDPAPEILTQWFVIGGKSPVLCVKTVNGQWQIGQVANASYNTNVGAYEKGKWTDFVFHVKWSTYSDGLVEIWKNGVRIYTKAGATLFTGAATAPFFKTGIYKWAWKSTGGPQSTTSKRIAYIDDMREGNELATYSDVAPGL